MNVVYKYFFSPATLIIVPIKGRAASLSWIQVLRWTGSPNEGSRARMHAHAHTHNMSSNMTN